MKNISDTYQNILRMKRKKNRKKISKEYLDNFLRRKIYFLECSETLIKIGANNFFFVEICFILRGLYPRFSLGLNLKLICSRILLVNVPESGPISEFSTIFFLLQFWWKFHRRLFPWFQTFPELFINLKSKYIFQSKFLIILINFSKFIFGKVYNFFWKSLKSISFLETYFFDSEKINWNQHKHIIIRILVYRAITLMWWKQCSWRT